MERKRSSGFLITINQHFKHSQSNKLPHKIVIKNIKIVYYPQTSPVGIVSICDPSTDQLMLIRQPRYPPGMYSCIAGFLDVGESLEDCVRREAAEEVGIQVDKVEFIEHIFQIFKSEAFL